MPLRFEQVAAAAALLLAPGATSFSSSSLATSRGVLSSLRASAEETLQDASAPRVARTPEEAKAKLRDALVESGGSTRPEGVVAACEVLAGFNPTSSPARAWPVHSGTWKAEGEEFVGTTRTPDGLECTLGRLAFNKFEPVELLVLITDISQTIGEERDETADPPTRYQGTLTRWVARDGSGLGGVCLIEGKCWEHPSNPDRVQTSYSKGTLKPDDGQDLEVWRKVFRVKDAKDAEKKGSPGRVKSDLKGPGDSQGPLEELSYEMPRSPEGYFDILYLDEEMRVTRGGRGSLDVGSRL